MDCCFAFTFDFRVLIWFIVEILFQMINIRKDEIIHNSNSVKEKINLLGRKKQFMEYFSQRFILYATGCLYCVHQKRFLNSFIDKTIKSRVFLWFQTSLMNFTPCIHLQYSLWLYHSGFSKQLCKSLLFTIILKLSVLHIW